MMQTAMRRLATTLGVLNGEDLSLEERADRVDPAGMRTEAGQQIRDLARWLESDPCADEVEPLVEEVWGYLQQRCQVFESLLAQGGPQRAGESILQGLRMLAEAVEALGMEPTAAIEAHVDACEELIRAGRAALRYDQAGRRAA